MFELDGKYQGFGNFKFADGMQYNGGWDNNRMQGGGKMINPNDEILQGIYENNYFFYEKNFHINPFLDQN